MKTLSIALLILLLSSCTSYSIEKGVSNGEPFTNVRVKSTRDLEQPTLHYQRTGADATFDFSAASVDNNTDAFVGMFQGMLQMMMQMMAAQPTPNTD